MIDINPATLKDVPVEARRDRQAALAWLRLVVNPDINEHDLPRWWPNYLENPVPGVCKR